MGRSVRLFTVDVDPTHKKGQLHLVSQHSEPSLALLVMLARGAKMIPAPTDPLRRAAILAETRDAVTRVLALYDLLAGAGPANAAWFEKAHTAARDVLTATQFGPYLVLEQDGPKREVGELVDQIAKLDDQLTAARGGEAADWLAERAAAWFTEIGMPQWTVPRRFDRAALQAQLAAAARGYRLADGLEDHQRHALERVLPVVIKEVERVADERVTACEITASEDEPTVELTKGTLAIALPPTGWSTFARRRLLDALGKGPPPMRVEYARGKV